MQKLVRLFFALFILAVPYTSHAILSMELTRGVAGAIPIAVVPFSGAAGAPQDVSGVISSDLQNSGRFKVYDRSALSAFPSDAKNVSADYFRRLGTDHVVVGKVIALPDGRYDVSFQLLDMFPGKDAASVVLSKKYTIPASELRAASHHISDLIYKQITGIKGIFSTRIAYVVVQNSAGAPPRYLLEVSDQDGYNPRPLLSSPEPIMSPSWSPNGKQLAYVSFENRKASIYLQHVITGARQQLSSFPGINGAPAWSWAGMGSWLYLVEPAGSNRRPPACKAGALPTELRPHMWPRK